MFAAKLLPEQVIVIDTTFEPNQWNANHNNVFHNVVCKILAMLPGQIPYGAFDIVVHPEDSNVIFQLECHKYGMVYLMAGKYLLNHPANSPWTNTHYDYCFPHFMCPFYGLTGIIRLKSSCSNFCQGFLRCMSIFLELWSCTYFGKPPECWVDSVVIRVNQFTPCSYRVLNTRLFPLRTVYST